MFTNKPISNPADLAGTEDPHAAGPDLAGVDPRHRRHAGCDGLRRHVSTAMQTRAIDGAELSFTAGYNAKFHEVAKYVCETRHILLINFEVISSKWFNSLPAEYQKVLEEECNKAGLEVSRNYLEVLDVQNLKNLQDKGMTLVPASEIDMAAFKAAGEKAYQKLNLVAARDKIYKEIGKKK